MCAVYVLSSPFVPYALSFYLCLLSVEGGGNEAAPSKQINCYSNALLHCHGNANLVEIHKESFKPTLTGAVTSLTRITQYFLDVQASIQELGRRQHTEAWKIHLKGDSVFTKCNPQCLHCFFC